MEDFPFVSGDWVIDRNNPGQPGQYTGKSKTAGPHIMVQLAYHDGSTIYRPLASLEPMGSNRIESLTDKVRRKRFGDVRDLRRLITFEKLKGTLHAVIYSMEAAQIDFYPYQFKPVIKFINSPTERLIIADEVGLGKTIESALIWIELQARRHARRLLIVCPKILGEKWQDELRSKFLLDARIVDFHDLKSEIQELKKTGPVHSFNLIATYTGLRPSKSELSLLNDPPGTKIIGSEKTEFLREIAHWSLSYEPFDLVIFDEAHYMRNPATTTFHLGECLTETAGAVLCVSATPVNNSNADLLSLLRLTDKDFFETEGLFNYILESNRSTVQAINALSRTPVDLQLLQLSIKGMGESEFIKGSPMFKHFLDLLSQFNPEDKSQLAKLQDIAEKLNLLNNYINRTRRVQVKENRPLRIPVVLVTHYTPEEMMLYNAIVQIVRGRCELDRTPFHVFQVMGLQLRAASCLPVLAREIKERRWGDIDELLSEAFGDGENGDVWDEESDENINPEELIKLLDYNFEKNDSKYLELTKFIISSLPEEKLVIFAYYRPTLSYLQRRLTKDGLKVTVIHGGIPNEKRWEEIERFKDPRGPQILLSSEVGSEGIDLQLCRVLINYDLPWNPMRIEQRIGRIDRVGQQAKRLSIINFKVKDTIEERLYDRLHSKLMLFENSLGDLEAVIGKEVQNLTINILSKDLSPEEERQLIEQTERAIESQLIQIKNLEESGDTLIAFSDYIQKRIEEDRQKGRYLQASELEDYLSDFFNREFIGCCIKHDNPSEGCLKIHLTNDAQRSLAEFIKDDRSLQARPLRQAEFNITFRREVMQQLPMQIKRSVHFVNNISPLIRWITKINREKSHSFYNVSSIRINLPELPEGDYCYRIERWKFTGLLTKETLSYGIASLKSGEILSDDKSEEFFQKFLKYGEAWHYEDCDVDSIVHHLVLMEEIQNKRFSEALMEFEMENTTNYQIKVQRVTNFFDRKIQQHKQRIQTLLEENRVSGMMAAAEGLLRKAESDKAIRLSDLEEKVQTDVEQAEVAAGIIRVIN